MLNNKYLITEWEQLRFIPTVKTNNINYGLKLCSIKYDNCICKTLSIIRDPDTHKSQTLYTFIVDTVKLDSNIALLDKQTIINIINSFGFNIEWRNQISLSVKEYDILCSLFRLGYNYVQRLKLFVPYNLTYLAVTENVLSTYDTKFIPKKMEDICNIKLTDNDFKWIETEQYISIPTILGINVRNSDYDGWS